MSHASLYPLRHVWNSSRAHPFSLLAPRRQTVALLALLASLMLWALPVSQAHLNDALSASDTPIAQAANEAQASPAPPPELSPAMRAALDYAARKYRVSDQALEPIFLTAQKAAGAARLDPLLVVAVIAVESSFNPFAQSSMGAQGLMQVIPRFHLEKLPEDADHLALFDPAVNVRVGTLVLQEYVRRHGDIAAGLQQFAGAADDPAQAYANKVLAEKDRLEAAYKRRAI